ncbi:MAG: ImmA/IrrE family metallo-endopeptidase [Rhizobiales bacterium]|nr:ImmA/IrrE family metallo-endopeptidase [Hyphomicrobiales bacterium]
MSLAFRLKMAKQKGEAFLRDEGITALPVDPFAIAASRDIEIKAKPDTAGGVSGMLLRNGNNFGIVYATHIKSEGFQRFSVGHELGHFFLDGHIDHILPEDGIHTSHAGFVSGDPYELEADHFAAGLLMPESLFKRALVKLDPGLAAVESMATLCKTSLTATGIRCAELSDRAVAVIISTGQTIDYCFMSDVIKSLPELNWLRKGSAVPPATATSAFNKNAGNVRDGRREAADVDALDWLGGKRSVILSEEIVGLGSYGKTMTVLSSGNLGGDDGQGDDDDGDDDRLAESWTPRFRR